MDLSQARLHPPEHIRAWTRVGVIASYVAAAALFAQSALYLLDISGLLEPLITFRATSAGLQSDLANFYAAFHERQHHLWWNVALRDTVGPLGYLALMALALSVRQVVRPGRPLVELTVLFVSAGAFTAAVCDVAFLSQIATWRGGGFRPTTDIVAFGRASEVLDHAISYVLHASYLVLALGFVSLGAALRTADPTLTRVTVLSYAQAAALLAMVLFRLVGLDTTYDVATALTGLVLGPVLVICWGRALPRLASASAAEPHGQRV